MEYTSSNAFVGQFAGRGCQVWADGIFIGEVKKLSIEQGACRNGLSLLMNWIPEDRGQEYLLKAAQEGFPNIPYLDIELIISPHRKVTWYRCLPFDFNISVVPNEVSEFYIRFAYQQVQASGAIHNVEDGPEVEIIEREQDIEFEPIANMIREYFASERAKEQTWSGCVRPVGGGFVEAIWPAVPNSHTYHYED